jgi:hypothetical protein
MPNINCNSLCFICDRPLTGWFGYIFKFYENFRQRATTAFLNSFPNKNQDGWVDMNSVEIREFIEAHMKHFSPLLGNIKRSKDFPLWVLTCSRVLPS